MALQFIQREFRQNNLSEAGQMNRYTHWGKRKNIRAQEDAVFCAKTGALISSAPPNVIPFPRNTASSGATKPKNEEPQIVDNDAI